MNDDPEKEAPNGEPRPEPTWREPQAAEERYTPGSASEEPRGTDTAQSASEEPRGTDAPQSAPDEPRIETDASQGTWEEPRPHRSDDARRAGLGEDAPPPGGEPPIARHLKSKATWLRLVFIVLFAIVYGIVELVLTAVVVIQFLWALFTGAPNERLRELGQSLARYVYQIVRFLTYNTDERPFPIDLDWPSGRQDEP